MARDARPGREERDLLVEEAHDPRTGGDVDVRACGSVDDRRIARRNDSGPRARTPEREATMRSGVQPEAASAAPMSVAADAESESLETIHRAVWIVAAAGMRRTIESPALFHAPSAISVVAPMSSGFRWEPSMETVIVGSSVGMDAVRISSMSAR